MNHYFLTGATGNIGSALVPLLLKSEGLIQLLIRADDDDHLLRRFDELCKFWGISKDVALQRMIPCRGDMTEPLFGLNETSYNLLSDTCTHIIHCGGIVRMNLPLEEARKSAAGTAAEIIRLAKKTQQKGQLKKIDYVSTVGVLGRSRNPLTEKLITEKRTFHNSYEQAKAEAEELLHRYMLNNSLPITIHRPSMVVGDSSTGKVKSFQVFYHICEFVSGKRTFGILPYTKAATLDIIPVDYVAEVIKWATENPESIGKFIHECSGPDQTLEINQIRKKLDEFAYFTKFRKIFCKNIIVSIKQFNFIISIIKPLLTKRQQKLIGTLPHFLNYIDDPQYFDNKKTDEILMGRIVKPVPINYLDNVINYYIAHATG